MLQAISRGKPLSAHPYEDEITATVFGPLPHLETKATWDLLNALLGNPIAPGDFAPQELDLDLWPQREISFQGMEVTVEPDLLITFQDATGETVRIILEVKWFRPGQPAAPLSSLDRSNRHDQLARQWVGYANGFNPGRVRHILLTPDPWSIEFGETPFALEDHQEGLGKAWRENAHLVTWQELRRHCEVQAAESSGNLAPMFQEWGKNVALALSRLGIRSFRGFRGFVEATPFPSHPLQLLGFLDLPRSGPLTTPMGEKEGNPIFFQEPEDPDGWR